MGISIRMAPPLPPAVGVMGTTTGRGVLHPPGEGSELFSQKPEPLDGTGEFSIFWTVNDHNHKTIFDVQLNRDIVIASFSCIIWTHAVGWRTFKKFAVIKPGMGASVTLLTIVTRQMAW